MDGRYIQTIESLYCGDADIGTCQCLGSRSSYEDLHLIFNKPGLSFFILMDGHSGRGVVDFMDANHEEYLDKYFSNYYEIGSEEIPDKAIKQFLREIDHYCVTELSGDSGATFTMLMVQKLIQPVDQDSDDETEPETEERTAYIIANVGDSRILLYDKNKNLIFTTTDHKAETERQRIENAGETEHPGKGPYVIQDRRTWRVLGRLEVSRAIGDKEYKTKNRNTVKDWNKFWNRGMVTAEPDISRYYFKRKTKIDVFIFCDGVVEGFKSDDALHEYIGQLLDVTKRPEKIASILVGKAAQRSTDNITCMYMRFNQKLYYTETKILKESRDNSHFIFNLGGLATMMGESVGETMMFMAKKTKFIYKFGTRKTDPEYDITAIVKKMKDIPTAKIVKLFNLWYAFEMRRGMTDDGRYRDNLVKYAYDKKNNIDIDFIEFL